MSGFFESLSKYYTYILIVLTASVTILFYAGSSRFLSWLYLNLFRLKLKITGSEKVAANLILLRQSQENHAFFFVLAGLATGAFYAYLARDNFAIALSAFFSMALIGITYYVGTTTDETYRQRIFLRDYLSSFVENLKTYSSTSQSLRQMQEEIEKQPADARDNFFYRVLIEINSQATKANSDIYELTREALESHKVYYIFSNIVRLAKNSGPVRAIEYAQQLIEQMGEWRVLASQLRAEVSGLRMSAMILDVMIIIMLGFVFWPDFGEYRNIFREYFFQSDPAMLILILLAHALVQAWFVFYLNALEQSI